MEQNLNEKITDILDTVKKSFPDHSIVVTESFINSVEKYMSEPTLTWDESIAKNCNEKIIDATVTTSDAESVFKLSISAHKANYGNYLYWKVSCDVPLNKEDKYCYHPFMMVADDVNDNYVGEVVADNEMIREMFKTLSMTDEDLASRIGSGSIITYRARIIKAISFFWD